MLSASSEKKPVRLALFGSFYRGYYVLKELLNGENSHMVSVVGVASDDPSNSFVSPEKRMWQYPHTGDEELLVPRVANEAKIDVFTGRVKTGLFYDKFENEWRPDLCIMSTFGQLINQRLFQYPKYGFYNLHPC